MRHRTKFVLTAFTATILLATAISTASAARFEVTNSERGFRIVWASLDWVGGGASVRCPITLEGTFAARTFTKTAEARIAGITAAAVGSPCTGGEMALLQATFPWDVRYALFGGTLPNIATITLRLIAVTISIHPTGWLNCLLTTEVRHPPKVIANVNGTHEITSVDAEPTAGIPLTGGFCSLGGEGHYEGNGTASVLGETAKTVLSLI